ncbi:MAG TPA: hypothetical protein ENN80_13060, partial [Candidatus Hydrogenedentes bacterium]|nr:hypothetical protein [Candidatus Hydrogenedentota bacterium]
FGPPPDATDEDLRLLQPVGDYYRDKTLFDMRVKEAREKGTLTQAGKDYMRYMYDGEVRYTDEHVGRLLAFVRARHPDAVIALTSDHGEELWEHGSIGHGKTVFQESIHVPLLLKAPGVVPRTVSTNVETIDILPTLAALLGLPSRDGWQGRDLIPIAQGAALERPVFAESRGSLREFGLYIESVTVGSRKSISKHKPIESAPALYDLDSDPLEQRDLATTHAAEVARLSQLLADYRKANEAHPAHAIGPVRYGLDVATREALKALGYLGDDD